MSFKEIPTTTAVRYISGLHSLNLDLRDGTGCGWHFSNLWLGGKAPIKLYGRGTPVNTVDIFGYEGVADRSAELRRLGATGRKIYLANHTRAAVDAVYESLTRYGHVGELAGAVDHFFSSDEQKKELFSKLLILRDYVSEERVRELDDWLSSEFRALYKSWRSGELQTEKAPTHN